MGRSGVVAIAIGCWLVGACTLMLARSTRLVNDIVERENQAPWYLRGRRLPVDVAVVRRRLVIQAALMWLFAVAVLIATAATL